MDTAQWPQVINGVVIKKPMESSADPAALVDKRVVRAQKEQPLNCPRCNSCNTKFCYYNNYSLSQPRYFCKTCRRYWTQGGSLRNVPVGGGSRKNKRPPPPTSSSKNQTTTLPQPSNLIQEGDHYDQSQNPSLTSSELSLSSYMPMIAPTVSPDSSTNNNSSTMFSSPGLLFPFQEFKPTLSYFSHGLMDSGISGGRTTLHHHHDQETKIDGFEQQLINRGQGLDSNHSIGFLNNGMFGGGSWQQL